MALIHTDCLSRYYSEKKTNIFCSTGWRTDRSGSTCNYFPIQINELICQKVVDYLVKQDKCISNREYKQWMVLNTHAGLKSKEQLEILILMCIALCHTALCKPWQLF